MPHDKPSFCGGSSGSYYSYLGRLSRGVAPIFLDWLEKGLSKQWIDFGCGIGELSQSIIAKCDPAELHGIDPAEAYVKYARIQNPLGKFSIGEAMKLNYPRNKDRCRLVGTEMTLSSRDGRSRFVPRHY